MLNLIIIKLLADTNERLVRSCLPDKVAKFMDVSSERPPARICTVSKDFSVSNS